MSKKLLTGRLKRVMALLLMLLPALLPVKAADGDEFNDGGFRYRVLSEADHAAEVIGYTGSATDIEIPSITQTSTSRYKVTVVGDHAFYESSLTSVVIPNTVTKISRYGFDRCYSLAQISIPESVTEIGEFAFGSNKSMTSISIPNSVTEIGECAFNRCTSLTTVKIPDSMTKIGRSVFQYCSGLISVEIPNSVTEIGYGAFESCSSLTSVEIPNSVTKIDKIAFIDCNSLTSVTIPNSVTDIEQSAFRGCSSLTEILIDQNNDTYASVDGVVYSKNLDILYIFPGGKNEVNIPNSVTEIGSSAFYGCSSLASVTIPDSVTEIGDYAFYDCDSLASVTIPDSVTEIGSSAFSYCCSLVSVTIPDSVTIIDEYTFYHCCSLASVTIPNLVTEIGYGAFYDCSSLTSVTIPNSVAEIGKSAFDNCPIAYLDYNAKCGLDGFDSSYLVELSTLCLGDDIKSIPSKKFKDCKNLSKVSIGNDVESIGDYAFEGCSSLKEFVTNTKNPSAIGKDAFSGIPDDVVLWVPYGTKDDYFWATGWAVFKNVEEMTAIVLNTPSSEIIKGNTLQLEASMPDATQQPTFTWASSDESVATVSAAGLVKAVGCGKAVITVSAEYEGASYNTKCEISVIPTFSISHRQIEIEPGVSFQLGIISEGATEGYKWRSGNTEIAYVNNCGLVTSMGVEGDCVISLEKDGDFVECSVSINNSVGKLPENVNYKISSDNTITITESPDAYGDIVIPEQVKIDGKVYTVTEIGYRAFADSYNKITSIYVPNTVTTIAKHAFIHCENLSYLHLGSKVESIGEGALGICRTIDVFEIEAVTPPILDVDCFWSTSINTLRVPLGSEFAYENTSYPGAYGWSKFSSAVVGYDFSSNFKAPEANEVTEPTAIIYESVTRDPDMLNVRLEPVGASTVIEWTSSNPEVATIDRGLITFLSKDGETVFGAATESGLTATSPSMSEESAAIKDVMDSESARPNDIYNLQGVCLKRNASQADIDALVPGLYIIGGKKVIVK